MASARAWAERSGFDYRLYGDEILDAVPAWFRDKAAGRLSIVTDLGRLLLARRLLAEGYRRTIWLDADILVFRPAALGIEVEREYAFGREIWVQRDPRYRLKAYRNVHNAVAVFVAGNSFLDFYIHACESVFERVEAGVPAQVLGPKLLGALHNVLRLPLIEEVGALSPEVVRDFAAGGGPALELLRRRIPARLHAANLCHSLWQGSGEEALIDAVCTRLLETGGTALDP